MIEIISVKSERPQFNLLLHGEPGSGKTTLAASCQDHPDLRDVLFINVEGGMLSIAHRGDIKQVKVQSTDEVENLLFALRENPKKYGKFRTLVIDSVTELQTMNLEELITEGVRKAKAAKKSRTVDEIYQEDYGMSTTRLRRIFRSYKESNHSVIFTALSKFVYPPTQTNSRSGVPAELRVDPLAVLPNLTNKLAKSLMGFVDFVWYAHYDTAAREHQIFTRPDGVIAAKTRGPKFARELGPKVTLNARTMMLPQIYDILLKTAGGAPAPNEESRPSPKKSAVKKPKVQPVS